MIRRVLIYEGHTAHALFGPYRDLISQRVDMFRQLNKFREKPWSVETASGERLIKALGKRSPKEQLLVIPAGESSKLDAVFTKKEADYLRNDFFFKGGRGYFTCGSAYWASKRRIYESYGPDPKTSMLPLFRGLALGPLCPHPSAAGCYFDTVEVLDGKRSCSVLLGGGGSFISFAADQKVSVLARYAHSELERIGKQKKWENAAIMVSHGEGASALLMFHPYYGAADIDVASYQRAFPDNRSDWERIRQSLSPPDERMRFVYDSVIRKLEAMEF